MLYSLCSAEGGPALCCCVIAAIIFAFNLISIIISFNSANALWHSLALAAPAATVPPCPAYDSLSFPAYLLFPFLNAIYYADSFSVAEGVQVSMHALWPAASVTGTGNTVIKCQQQCKLMPALHFRYAVAQ